MLLLKYIGKLLCFPRLEMRLFFNSILYSLFFKVIINILPLKYYIGLFKSNNTNFSNKHDFKYACNLSNKTLKRLNILMPFEMSCVVKSLTFKYILRDLGYPSNVAIEVIKSPNNSLITHAFVAYQNKPVYLYINNTSSKSGVFHFNNI